MLKKTPASIRNPILGLLMLCLGLTGCGQKPTTITPHKVAFPSSDEMASLWEPYKLPGLPKTYGEYLIDSYMLRATADAYEDRLNELRQVFDSLKCVPASGN